MQITTFVALSVLAAGIFCDANVIVPANPGMMMLSSTSTNPGNSPNAPGSTPLKDQYPGQIYKWDYPESNTLKAWPAQPNGSNRDECSLTIKVNVVSLSTLLARSTVLSFLKSKGKMQVGRLRLQGCIYSLRRCQYQGHRRKGQVCS